MVELSIPRSHAPDSRRAQRDRLLAWRTSWPAADRVAANERIVSTLQGLVCDFQDVGVIAVYWAIRGEPELPPVEARDYWGCCALALPRVRARDEPLEFGLWRDCGVIRQDRWGIGTPEPFEAVEPALLILPCVGFDRRGFRLGYGGGFYDRTLAVRKVPTIGLAYDRCELDDFKPQPHDRPLDLIVTESRVIRPGFDDDHPAVRR